MANSYTQLYLQFVFATKYRVASLHHEWDEKLRMYISGIVRGNGHKLIAINNMPDHIHLLVGLHPNQSISDLMRVVKGDSSEWINKERLTPSKFQWQEGYGAFSYSRSQVDSVVKYIEHQQEHHRKVTFREEYVLMLQKFGIEYDDRYIFQMPL